MVDSGTEEWQTRVELAEHIFAFACGLRASYFLHGGPEAADTLCDGLALLQSSTYLLVPSLLKSYTLLIFYQLQERHKPCWSQGKENWPLSFHGSTARTSKGRWMLFISCIFKRHNLLHFPSLRTQIKKGMLPTKVPVDSPKPEIQYSLGTSGSRAM